MVASLTATTTRLGALLCVLVATALVLRAGPAGATVVQIQQGSLAESNNGSLTVTLPSASTAGTLLVAAVSNEHLTSAPFSGPAGWTKAVTFFDTHDGTAEIWYYVNNPGGITSATFTASSGTDLMAGEISEWNGMLTASVLDKTGTKHQGSATTATVTTANLTASNELGVTSWVGNTAVTSFAPGSGWTSLYSDPPNTVFADYKTGLASGAPASETVTSNPKTDWVGVIATFKSASCSGGSLTLTAPGSTSFTGVTLNGTNQTTTATVTLKPDDETTAHSGWNITETSTTFTDGSGHSLSTTATTTTGASSSAAGGNCVMPTNSVTYPVALPAGAGPPTAVKVYNAASGTGQGPTNVTLTFQLSIPANAYRGTYTSTWTFAIVSGP